MDSPKRTIEQKISDAFIIKRGAYAGQHASVSWWLVDILNKWPGYPYECVTQPPEYYTNDTFKAVATVHQIVKEASTIECLTSKFPYIREYKKWVLKIK